MLITRNRTDAAPLAARLAPCGIELRPYPVLRLTGVTGDPGWRAVERLAEAPATGERWLLFASPRAPERFAAQLAAQGLEALAAWPAAAVGTATAQAAREAGFSVALTGPGTGAGLARELAGRLGGPSALVFACGRDRRPELPRALEAAGHRVLPVVVYRMDPTPPRELPPLTGPRIDAVILTSPRAARYYLEALGGRPLDCPHWALGSTTRDAAAAMGIECRIPPRPDMESLAEELCRN